MVLGLPLRSLAGQARVWRTSGSHPMTICLDVAAPRARACDVHARRMLRLRAHGTQTATGARCMTRRALRSGTRARTRAQYV
jgi:hypothetical protein